MEFKTLKITPANVASLTSNNKNNKYNPDISRVLLSKLTIANSLQECMNRAPKDFKLITNQAEVMVNQKAISSLSHLISRLFLTNPSLQSYKLQTDDSGNFIPKLGKILNGEIVDFLASEKKNAKKILRELEILKVPKWLNVQFSTTGRNFPTPPKSSFTLCKENFLYFIRNEAADFEIKIGEKSYFCSSIAVNCSNVIYQHRLNNPSSKSFVYEIEDPKQFKIFHNFFRGQVLELMSKNIESALKIAEDLQIDNLIQPIKEFMKQHQVRISILRQKEPLIDKVNKLQDLLMNLTEDNFEHSLDSILSSEWCNDEEAVKELIANIFIISSFSYKRNRILAKFCKKLVENKDKVQSLRIFTDFVKTFIRIPSFAEAYYINSRRDLLDGFHTFHNFEYFNFILYLRFENILSNSDLADFDDIKMNSYPLSHLKNYSKIGHPKVSSKSYLCRSTSYFIKEIRELYPNIPLTIDLINDKLRMSYNLPNTLANAIFNDDLNLFIKLTNILPSNESSQNESPQNNQTKNNQELFDYNLKILVPYFFSYGFVPLIDFASYSGSPKIFYYLVKKSVQITECTFYMAIKGGCSSILEYFIRSGVHKFNKNPIPKYKNERSQCPNLEALGFNCDYRYPSFTSQPMISLLELSVCCHQQKVFEELFKVSKMSQIKKSILTSIIYNNLKAFTYIIENLITFNSTDNLKEMGYSSAVGYSEFFELLISLFDTDKIIGHQNENPSFLYNFHLDETYFSSVHSTLTASKFGSIKIIEIIKNSSSYSTGLATTTAAVIAAFHQHLDLFNYLVKTFNVKLSDAVIIRLLETLFIMKNYHFTKAIDDAFVSKNIDEFNSPYIIKLMLIGYSHLQMTDKVKYFVEKMQNVYQSYSYENEFIIAAKNGDLEMTQFIQTLPINLENILLENFLVEMIQNNHLNTFEVVINAVPMEKHEYYVHFCLKYAMKYRKDDFVEFLLTFNVNLNELLSCAAYEGYLNVMQHIANNRAMTSIINYPTDEFDQPIFSAIKSGNQNIVEYLLTFDTLNLTFINKFNETTLDYAAKTRQYSIFILLFNTIMNATPNERDKKELINHAFLTFCLPKFIYSQKYYKKQYISFYPTYFMGLTKHKSIKTLQGYDQYPNVQAVDMYNSDNVSYLVERYPEYFCDEYDYSIENQFLDFFFGTQLLDFNYQNNGETFLINAVKAKRIDIVQKILAVHEQTKVNVNYYDNSGNTALIYSVMNGSIEIFKELMKCKDLDVNHRNFYGRTALTFAAYLNNVYMTHLLIHHPEFNAEKSNTVLAAASALMNDCQYLFNYILENLDFDINKTVKLYKIDMKEKKSSLNDLISDIEGENDDYMEISLLYVSLICKNLTNIKKVIEYKRFDMNRSNIIQSLFYAIAYVPNIEIAKYLLNFSKLDINCTYKGISLLETSIFAMNKENPKFVLEHPDFIPDPLILTKSLCLAIIKFSNEAASLICMNTNININDQCPSMNYINRGSKDFSDFQGKTPLTLAMKYNTKIIPYLFKVPSLDINAKNSNGTNALFVQNENAFQKIIYRTDININAYDNKGNSLLVYVIQSMNRQVGTLLKKGFDITVKNSDGKNIIQVIDPESDIDLSKASKGEIISILKKYYMEINSY
ncbi:hypothetical protein TRFO_25060 [Tritrichomonas foetus]|uniref:Uncharacterized protein n=1 Tax=Tritrichomonas foetus TaxID=1144522 RepID=A0A1J4K6R4_9EUKA|nr:hypothetical protein TRFO_25060 [Tritrichomonas foetus]|eukprot:OHT06875.1 hypothetical protein TRFO_25060 [Tritrichomonas foetus]